MSVSVLLDLLVCLVPIFGLNLIYMNMSIILFRKFRFEGC